MENTNAKLTIVKILQAALTGELHTFSTFNPQHTADAIVKKVEFDRTYGEANAKKLTETVEAVKKSVKAMKEEMKNELSTCGNEEKLLANFIRGKLTSYEEILDVISKL